MATARSTFLARIKSQTGDTSGVYFTDAEINQWIQDCLNDLARETHYFRPIVQAGIVANQEKYQIYPITLTVPTPDEYYTPLEISRVLVMTSAAATAYTQMEPMSWDQYQTYQDGKETESVAGTAGTPTHYVIQGEYLYLYPYPNYDHATHGLRLYLIATEYLTADASTTTLPLAFEDAVVWYGAWRAHMKDNDPSIAAGYLGKYERLKGQLREWVSSMRTNGPQRIPYHTERKVNPH